MAWVSLTMPVTLLAAENEPMRGGRAPYLSSSRSSWAASMCPSASWGITTTSATDSRQGSSLERLPQPPPRT